jgi:hypothetical protein
MTTLSANLYRFLNGQAVLRNNDATEMDEEFMSAESVQRIHRVARDVLSGCIVISEVMAFVAVGSIIVTGFVSIALVSPVPILVAIVLVGIPAAAIGYPVRAIKTFSEDVLSKLSATLEPLAAPALGIAAGLNGNEVEELPEEQGAPFPGDAALQVN